MRKRSYTNEQFTQAVADSTSWNQVFQKLGRKIGGSQHVAFQQLAKKLNLDTKHFTGKGWNIKNKSKQLKEAIPLSEILVSNSTYTNTHCLKGRLIKEGYKQHQCEICYNVIWNNKSIPIQLDHINGNRMDNRLENLRILCPNCHAQTDTYAGKNVRKIKLFS